MSTEKRAGVPGQTTQATINEMMINIVPDGDDNHLQIYPPIGKRKREYVLNYQIYD